MSKESRVVHLQKELIEKGYDKTLMALNWMIGIMNNNNGYSRHDGSHYYYHLVDGCQDLINHGIKDENTLTAYVLHDSIEDISYVTEEMIADKFGGEVALLVSGVTKKVGVDYKDTKNMLEYLNYISQFPKMCLIKTADRKHNFSTLENAKPEKELRQAEETEKLFLPFFKRARQMYPEYSSYFHSAKTSIVPHLKKIKKYHADIELLENRIKELEYKLLLFTKEVK